MKKKEKKVKIPKLGPSTTRAEWLQTVIKLTETAIDPISKEDGNGMIAQAARYTNELKGLRKA